MAAASTSGRARVALGVLLAGFVAIDLIASTDRSPVRPLLPGGVRPPSWSASPARWIGLDRLVAGTQTAIAFGVLVILVIGFVLVMAEAFGGRVNVRTAAACAGAAILIAAAGPVLLSRDVSSYAAYGRMVAVDHGNPYLDTPATHPDDPFARAVSPEWRRSRSVYGPVFTDISAGVVAAGPGSPAATIVGFKVLAALAVAGATWFAAAAAARRDERFVAPAVALVGLNPVIVVHTVGGAHNDALVALGVAGAALVVAARPWPPSRARALTVTAILTVTALVKVVAVLPLAMFVVAIVLATGRTDRRARTALEQLGLIAALVALSVIGYGWPAVRALGDLASRRGWASAARLAARGVDSIGGPTGSVLRVVVAAAFVAALAVVLVALVRRGPRVLGSGAAWGNGMLAAALAGPYLLPWYGAWFAPELATVRDRATVWIGIAACAVLALTGVPAEPAVAPALYRSALLAVHYVAAPIVAVLLAALVLRSLDPGHPSAGATPAAAAAEGDVVPAS